MDVFRGSDIQLGIFLTRNHRPISGQEVLVQVVNQETGAAFLASTPCPETAEPGVYNFPWLISSPTPPPNVEVDMLALFNTRSKIFSQAISIVPRGGAEDSGDLFAAIDQTDLNAIIDGSDDLVGVIDESTELVAVLNDSALETGIGSTTEELIATLE